MGRPHKFRNLSDIKPKYKYYKPDGVQEDFEKIFLTAEEFEAMRLRHYEHKKQTIAADEMAISQTTYSRIVTHAYEKITRAFIEGYALYIQDSPNKHPEFISEKIQNLNSSKNKKPVKLSEEMVNLDTTVFSGFGCQNCGYEWDTIVSDFSDPSSKHKTLCPECHGHDTYRLIKRLVPK